MKKNLVTSLIVGYIGGILGALIFQPLTSILSVLLSDFAIGGLIIGAIMTHKSLINLTMPKKIGFGVLVGLGVFLVFGLISGELVKDLIAGAFIGLLVGLVNHFFSKKINDLVN